MFEYIKTLIMGIVVGITAPLPVSSSGHFVFMNELLGFSEQSNMLSFYYSFFMVAFSVVIMVNLKELYSKTLKSLTKKQKNYKLRLDNILMSFAVCVLLFIPIPRLGSSLSDYFDSFLNSGSILNRLLTGLVCILSGLLLAVSAWYIKKGKSSKKKTVPVRSALRMYIYSAVSYVIPGASKITLSTVNLTLCDVSSDVIFREVYFYLAPQVLIIHLVKLVIAVFRGITFDAASLAVGLVAAALSGFAVMSIVRKADSKKLLIIFSIYSVLFGLAVAAGTVLPIISGI